MRNFWYALLAVGVVAAAGNAQAGKPPQPPSWTALALNTAPGIYSFAYDMTEAGDVVGRLGPTTGPQTAVLWETSGGTVVEHLLTGGYTACGANEFGEIAGAGGPEAAYWESYSEGPALLPQPPGHEWAEPFSLNDDGVIVGYSQDQDGSYYPVV